MRVVAPVMAHAVLVHVRRRKSRATVCVLCCSGCGHGREVHAAQQGRPRTASLHVCLNCTAMESDGSKHVLLDVLFSTCFSVSLTVTSDSAIACS